MRKNSSLNNILNITGLEGFLRYLEVDYRKIKRTAQPTLLDQFLTNKVGAPWLFHILQLFEVVFLLPCQLTSYQSNGANLEYIGSIPVQVLTILRIVCLILEKRQFLSLTCQASIKQMTFTISSPLTLICL